MTLLIPVIFYGAQGRPEAYTWKKVTEHAGFPGSYNFPIFAVGNKLWAFHDQGNWFTEDGTKWIQADLPKLDFNSGYQPYVLFKGAIFALGSKEGNYLNLELGTRIAKTSPDFKKWDVIAETSSVPPRVFYGPRVFDSKIWLFGGFHGKNYFNDVWNSHHAENWRRDAATSPWSSRSNPSIVLCK